MDYSVLFSTILRLAILLGIGAWLTYKISFTKDVRSFVIFILINIALPAIILKGFLSLTIDDSLLHQLTIVFFFSLSYNIIGLILGWTASRSMGLKGGKARETGFLSIFGNTGLIGIPLCASMFGAKGAVLAAVFDAGMSLLLWTVGILFLQGNKNITLRSLKTVISTPNVTIVIGLLLTFLQIDPGPFVKDVTFTLAGLASPLAMFYIGMMIMTMFKEKRSVSPKLLAIPVTFKMLVFPLIGIVALSALPFSEQIEQVILVEMAMPAITTASIIFAMCKADEDYGVMHTLFTNMIALVSIPVIVLIGGFWL